jgi:CubicO group peptidase (beta-lactamase class C family)/D-alanyl-D-alanine dipeptidase
MRRRRRTPSAALQALVALSVGACASSPPALIPPSPEHVPAAQVLAAFIEHERQDKGIPAMAIALVDRGQIAWARGFGLADPATGRRADANTLFRVGSVSKLLTGTALQQLAQEGRVDLDAPLTEVLPDFALARPPESPITLRRLLSHRAGLVREPPLGSYSDPEAPDLGTVAASLARTRTVHPPGEREKYSNAGYALAGHALEAVTGTGFEEHVAERVLRPAGMRTAAWRERPGLGAPVARGSMWSYDGRAFAAPTFPLGALPACNLLASVTDLARFAGVVLADARGAGRLLEAPSLEAMWRPAGDPELPGSGLAWGIGTFQGRRQVGHDGAVYGFSSTLRLLPEDDLGVVVVATLDLTNAVVDRVADLALNALLALRDGVPPPYGEVTIAVDEVTTGALSGDWRDRDGSPARLRIEPIEGEPHLTDSRGGFRRRIRRARNGLIVDDRLAHGLRLVLADGVLTAGGLHYVREERSAPPACPARWRGLIGEFGPDHDPVVVLERDGRLHALVAWFIEDPLEELGHDRFRFPAGSLYAGEELRFERDDDGVARRLRLGGVEHARRGPALDEEDTFRIAPQHAVERLRALALDARPPRETGKRAPELVDLRSRGLLSFDVRYASEHNFLGTALYEAPEAWAQRPAAEALTRAAQRVLPLGYGLLVHDAFRPWRVTKMFWDATPEDLRAFVADPSRGSRHNRGCAIDLSLVDLVTGEPIEMVSGYDEFSPRASPTYPGGTSLQRWHRDVLRTAMEAEGFAVYPNEWWHFDHEDWREYPIIEDFPR